MTTSLPLLGHGAHQHSSAAVSAVDILLVGVLAALAIGYPLAVRSSAHRRSWPRHRLLCWYLGLACLGVGLAGPVAHSAMTSYTAHMASHVLVGMLAPLLLVLGAPVRALLRVLPSAAARSVVRLLHAPPLRFLAHPATAAILNAGGLWVLYTTDLFELMHSSTMVHIAVHVHVFVAGYVFTAAIVSVDPMPHRASLTVRSVVLVAFVAAHSILAKWLYAHPPTGVEPHDGRVGAQLMYYAGDAVDILLIVLLMAQWYRSTRPVRPHRAPVSAGPGTPGGSRG